MKVFDLQINGYAGVDFCSADLGGEDLRRACDALAEDGVDQILATIITDTIEALEQKLRRLSRLREQDCLVERMIAGIHLEGPFLNESPGYIGAHPPGAVVPANVDDAKRLTEAASGLIRIVTLAPERDPGFATTRFLANNGIVVSAGHCDPPLDVLHGAIDQGLSMATHLGNGCPLELPRHDNIIQRILHLREHLWIGFIPDGIHVDYLALKNYLDLVGMDRAFFVTDAIAAARMRPGLHQLSGMTVEVDQDGAARRPGLRMLAGSTLTLPDIRARLGQAFGWGETELCRLLDENPRRVLRVSPGNKS